jgi:hypothetical protein
MARGEGIALVKKTISNPGRDKSASSVAASLTELFNGSGNPNHWIYDIVVVVPCL